MTGREFIKWLAFYEMEPFGSVRDNIHSGQVASLLYNINRRKNAQPLNPSDFILKDRESKQDESTHAFLSGIRALAKPKVH